MVLGEEVMNIELTNEAVRQYKRLKEPVLSRITEAIDGLEIEPPIGDIIKLTDMKNKYRMRIGDYRILYEKKLDNLILIHRIIRRGQAYKE